MSRSAPNRTASPVRLYGLLVVTMLVARPALGASTGRDENTGVRSAPYTSAAIRSGPYPEGEALPEQPTEGGVLVAGQTIRTEHYEEMKRSGYLPMRRELTDAELLAALKPDVAGALHSAAELADYARGKLSDYVPFLYWGFRRPETGQVPRQAEETYTKEFTPEGQLKPRYLGNASPPTVAMLRWGSSYWNTNDEKWARAVRDAFMPYYRANRPPLGKVDRSSHPTYSIYVHRSAKGELPPRMPKPKAARKTGNDTQFHPL